MENKTVHISSKCQYAIKALVRLALSSGDGPVQSREIAEFGGVPPKFLEQVMHDLRQAGLVTSQRGKGGGYALAGDPSQITFAAVRQAIDGPFGGAVPNGSRSAADALVDPVWHEVRMAVRDVLERATLADAVARLKTDDMYYI